jgi:hypothetical protein
MSALRTFGPDGYWLIQPEHTGLDASSWVATGKPPTLADMQKAVGGYIELIRIDDTAFGWVNEEGKLNGAPYNPVATVICRALNAIDLDDHIVGPMMITVGKACPD